MNPKIHTALQIREVFHLEFLRWFSRKLGPDQYALKGGTNLRFFFRSMRYSEDMDIDVQRVRVERVKKTVMDILSARELAESLKFFGIEKIIQPDIIKAKQTETTQRFKIHLLTSGGEDFFTKIDFSRRGLKGSVAVEPVSAEILRSYKMAPLLVPHYEAASAVEQKIQALALRSILQARDIFDLFLLSSQVDSSQDRRPQVSKAVLGVAYENIFLAGFSQFRDTVVNYLGVEDQKVYSSPAVWDEIKLKTAHFLEGIKNQAANFS